MHPLIPLLIVVIILLVGAVVGFVIYTVATDIANKTSKKMEENNLNIGKDGLKINVRQMKNEDYVGRTQDVLVKAWNLSTWPAYKSRFWNKESASGAGSSRSAGAVASSSGSSSHRRPSPSPSHASSGHSSPRVQTTTHRTENGRLAEPRPSYRRTASGSSIPGSFD